MFCTSWLQQQWRSEISYHLLGYFSKDVTGTTFLETDEYNKSLPHLNHRKRRITSSFRPTVLTLYSTVRWDLDCTSLYSVRFCSVSCSHGQKYTKTALYRPPAKIRVSTNYTNRSAAIKLLIWRSPDPFQQSYIVQWHHKLYVGSGLGYVRLRCIYTKFNIDFNCDHHLLDKNSAYLDPVHTHSLVTTDHISLVCTSCRWWFFGILTPNATA